MRSPEQLPKLVEPPVPSDVEGGEDLDGPPGREDGEGVHCRVYLPVDVDVLLVVGLEDGAYRLAILLDGIDRLVHFLVVLIRYRHRLLRHVIKYAQRHQVYKMHHSVCSNTSGLICVSLPHQCENHTRLKEETNNGQMARRMDE